MGTEGKLPALRGGLPPCPIELLGAIEEVANESDDADGCVKRPKNSYILFCDQQRKVSVERLSQRRLSAAWKEMTAAEKKPFIDESTRLKKTFNEQHPDFKFKYVRRTKQEHGASNAMVPTYTKQSLIKKEKGGKSTAEKSCGTWTRQVDRQTQTENFPQTQALTTNAIADAVTHSLRQNLFNIIQQQIEFQFHMQNMSQMQYFQQQQAHLQQMQNFYTNYAAQAESDTYSNSEAHNVTIPAFEDQQPHKRKASLIDECPTLVKQLTSNVRDAIPMPMWGDKQKKPQVKLQLDHQLQLEMAMAQPPIATSTPLFHRQPEFFAQPHLWNFSPVLPGNGSRLD